MTVGWSVCLYRTVLYWVCVYLSSPYRYVCVYCIVAHHPSKAWTTTDQFSSGQFWPGDTGDGRGLSTGLFGSARIARDGPGIGQGYALQVIQCEGLLWVPLLLATTRDARLSPSLPGLAHGKPSKTTARLREPFLIPRVFRRTEYGVVGVLRTAWIVMDSGIRGFVDAGGKHGLCHNCAFICLVATTYVDGYRGEDRFRSTKSGGVLRTLPSSCGVKIQQAGASWRESWSGLAKLVEGGGPRGKTR